jgi:hypothetical protein
MLTAVIAVWLVAGAGAQPADAPEPGRRRAPLANVEDLEPAVDVGVPRVAAVDRPVVPAATSVAPPAPPAAPAAPNAPRTGTGRAMDSLDLGTTSITGNQELPKVLYIVPWKRSDLGDLVGRPVNTLLDEVLAPVDPEVFERHLDYYETLHGASQEE